MKALVVGLGSAGKRHLGNLRRLAPAADITVWRQHARPAEHEAEPAGADRVVYSLEQALAVRPGIAIIANPAPFHIEAASQLAREGASLLIEKPLSDSMAGVEDLIKLCRVRGQTLMIGYNLRFLPSMQAMHQAVQNGRLGKILSVIAEVGQYLPDWRPGTDYTQGVSAQSRLGGGAILELSHELDYTRWLVGEVDAVSAQTAVRSELLMDAENIADIHLRFVCGVMGSLHLDMWQRAPTRTCKLIGTQATLVWDGIADRVRLFSATTNSWEDLGLPQSQHPSSTYVDEMQHFLDHVKSGEPPITTGEDGLQVLRIALAARESARLQRTVEL